MTDKTIRIGAEASSLAKARKEVDALSAALERLRRSGVSIPGAEAAGKIGDLTSSVGVAKYSKELLSATGHMSRLTETARGFVRVMGDAKISSTLKGIGREYDAATSKLEKLARVWEKLENRSTRTGRTISAQTRESFANQAAAAQATRTRAWGEKMQLAGGGGGPATAGELAFGAAVGGAAYMGVTGVAGGYMDRVISQREARVGAMAPVTGYLGQMLSGKGIKELYLRRLGVEDAARGDAKKLTTAALLRRGKFAAAMGLPGRAGYDNEIELPTGALDVGMWGLIGAAIPPTLGAIGGFALGGPPGAAAGFAGGAKLSVAAGLAAGGAKLWSGGGIPGMMEDTGAQRSIEETRQYYQARAAYEAMQQLNTMDLDTHLGKVPTYAKLQRGLGMSMPRLFGALRGAGIGDFGFDATTGAMMGQMGVGARGVVETKRAQELARYQGIENAPVLAAKLGLASGFQGNQQAQLEAVLAIAFEKGMDRSEMKVERESMVNAIVEATSRAGQTSYLTPTAAIVQASLMGAGLPGQGATLNDVAAADRAMAMLRETTSADSGQYGVFNQLGVMKALKKYGGEKILGNMNDLIFLMDQPADQLYSNETARRMLTQKYGFSKEKTNQILAAAGAGKGEAGLMGATFTPKEIENLGWKVVHGEASELELDDAARQLSARDARFKGDFRKARQYVASMSKAAVTGGKPTWEDEERNRFLNNFGVGQSVQQTQEQALQKYMGAVDEAQMSRMEPAMGAVDEILAAAPEAAKAASEEVESRKDEKGRLTETAGDVVKNLDAVTAALGRLSGAAAQFAGQYPTGQ